MTLLPLSVLQYVLLFASSFFVCFFIIRIFGGQRTVPPASPKAIEELETMLVNPTVAGMILCCCLFLFVAVELFACN